MAKWHCYHCILIWSYQWQWFLNLKINVYIILNWHSSLLEFKYIAWKYKWILALRRSVEDSEGFGSETHLSSFQIIGDELLRNLGLTICAVAIVTLILIQNLQTSFWVLSCVIFTVVDVVGSMYWLGLTIEISTSIMILLCAGLAVDYSAHIGNEFTRLQGTKDGTLSDYKLRFLLFNMFHKS